MLQVVKEDACTVAALKALQHHKLPQDIMQRVLGEVRAFWEARRKRWEYDLLVFGECAECGEMEILVTYLEKRPWDRLCAGCSWRGGGLCAGCGDMKTLVTYSREWDRFCSGCSWRGVNHVVY